MHIPNPPKGYLWQYHPSILGHKHHKLRLIERFGIFDRVLWWVPFHELENMDSSEFRFVFQDAFERTRIPALEQRWMDAVVYANTRKQCPDKEMNND